jgi:acyl-CoA synthetase (AMP-forming)/AMP-acid ligase II
MKDPDYTGDRHISRVFRSSFPDVETTSFRTNAWRSYVPKAAEELRPYHPTVLHAFATAAKLEETMGITLLPEREDGKAEHRSYRDLYAGALLAAANLRKKGLRFGDRVLIVLPTSFEFILSFFAVQMAGGIPVPSYPPPSLERVELALERLARITHEADASLCITNRALRTVLGSLVLLAPGIRDLVIAEDLQSGRINEAARPKAQPSDLALLQFTSGSTSYPKGVALTHAAVVGNMHATGQASQFSRRDLAVSWLPLYHDMGLIATLLTCVYWRMPLVLMSPVSFLLNPVRWLRAITEYGATVSAAPNFAYGLCCKRISDEERQKLDLSTWRIAYNGAEPVSMATIAEFWKLYEPLGFRPTTMLPVYGLAESTVAVAFPKLGEGLRCDTVDRAHLASGRALPSKGKSAVTLVGVGQPIPGHRVIVVDDRGQPVKDREVGHIVTRGPSLMQGYYGNEEATAKILRDGWLWTGDLGYFVDGYLFVTGRAKDLLIVRGKNYYAEDVEHVAERVLGARPGGTAAFGVYDEKKATDLAVLVCETKLAKPDERAQMVERIEEEIAERAGLRLDEIVLVVPGTIPRTSSGKRQRALCREMYLGGSLVKKETGKLQLAAVFARSAAGLLLTKARRLFARSEPQ